MAKQSPLDHLIKDPKAAGLLQNKEAVERLLSSPDTQKLMELLNRSAGGGLKQAAEAAMKGDTGQIMGLMDQLMKDPEGAQAVQNINKSVSK